MRAGALPEVRGRGEELVAVAVRLLDVRVVDARKTGDGIGRNTGGGEIAAVRRRLEERELLADLHVGQPLRGEDGVVADVVDARGLVLIAPRLLRRAGVVLRERDEGRVVRVLEAEGLVRRERRGQLAEGVVADELAVARRSEERRV